MTIPSLVRRTLHKFVDVAESLLPSEPDKPIGPHWHDWPEAIQCIGENVRIDPSVRIDVVFGLAIGNNVSIGPGTYIDAQAGLILCDGVQIADSVSILTSLPLPSNVANPQLAEDRAWGEVFIGRNVKIGARACIFPGVTIGEGAEIAPGTIVLANVPAFERRGFTAATAPEQPLSPEQLRQGYEMPMSDPAAAPPVIGRIRRPDITFVASTGRSGSTAIVDLLSQHSHIVARHEPRNQITKLSTDYAHGLISRDEARASLERLYLDGTVYHPDRLYVESDQKYFNLIPILQDILPDARFVWLIRSAYDVVASTFSRSWYGDPSHPVWYGVKWFYHKYRVAGDDCGAMTVQEWASMSPFERNCWYWSYVNETIARDLSSVPKERQMLLRLEELGARSDELVGFLGGEAESLSVVKSNEAFYKKIEAVDWTPEQHQAFERICGPMMKKIYG